jgi:Protein of unknown function (DUF1097)
MVRAFDRGSEIKRIDARILLTFSAGAFRRGKAFVLVTANQRGKRPCSIDQLSCVPANVYGYAALVGYTLSAGKLDALTAADNSNPLFLIIVSAVLGGVLGYLMGQLAGVLKVKPAK